MMQMENSTGRINALLLILCTSILAGCNIRNKEITSTMHDEVRIYSLPQFSNYLVAVNCNNIKNMDDTTLKIIRSPKKVREYKAVFDTKNLEFVDTKVDKVEYRMLIELRKGESIENSVCWSPIERIQIDDKLYSYNEEVETFLLKEKLITKVIIDDKLRDSILSSPVNRIIENIE